MPSHPEPRTYAPIEDLDPEPSPAGGRLRRREVVLGVVLLVLVLGFAGWDWWRQEGLATAYRAGEQAAMAQQWDAAEVAFRSVGAYRDAPARAVQATTNRVERDRQYAAAQAALEQGDTLAALLAARAVEQVQQDYRDTAALLERAQGSVLRTVLSGTVALRPTAQPPGLYRYGAAGWEWLPGSDATSQVEGSGAPGYVLYDGPNPGLPRAAARVLIRADLSQDPAPTETFILNPTNYSRYRVGADGVWGIRDSHLRAPALTSVTGYGNADLTYQATGAPRFQTLLLPSPEWMVMDLAPDGRHYLLADLSQATGDTPTSLLYYAGGASYPQALYAVSGLLLRAQFSPDGGQVLLTTQSRANRTDAVQTVQLLDRAQLAGPGLLDPAGVRTLLRQAIGADAAAGLGAMFLTASPRAGQIVLLRRTAADSQLSLYDPAAPDAAPVVLWTGPIPANAPLWLRAGTDAGLLFGWPPDAYTDNDLALGRVNAALVYINGQNRGVLLRPWVSQYTRLGPTYLVGDQLVYEGLEMPTPLGTSRAIYSLALHGVVGERPIPRHFGAALPAGGVLPDPTLLYTTGLLDGVGEPIAFSPPWLATIQGETEQLQGGGTLIQYGTLHLRSTDGTVDVPLTDGVQTLFPVAGPFTADSVQTLP